MKNPFQDREELATFIKSQLMTTAQVVEYLGITRQRVKELVDDKKLIPIIKENKIRLFLRHDVEARKAETPELRDKYRPYDKD